MRAAWTARILVSETRYFCTDFKKYCITEDRRTRPMNTLRSSTTGTKFWSSTAENSSFMLVVTGTAL